MKKKFLQFLKKEIEWCEECRKTIKASNKSKDWENGFVAGLKHSYSEIKKLKLK